MRILTPQALWFALSIPIILILHMILRRRKRHVVPSLMPWEDLLRTYRKSVRFRTITYNTNLFLQLAAAAALTLALAGPVIVRQGAGEGRTIVILDGTASMRAREGGTSRFELAKEAVRDVIRGLPPGAPVTLILGGTVPEFLTGMDAPPADALRAAAALEESDETGDMNEALELAFTLAGIAGRDRVVLVTDGAFDPSPGLDLEAAGVEVVSVGNPTPNAGLSGFRFRRLTDESGYEILSKVRNYGQEDRPVTVEIRIDGGLLDRRTVPLLPGEEAAYVVRYAGIIASEATAEILGEDSLAADDKAFAVLNPETEIRVLYSGEGNYFLEEALAAYPAVRLSRDGNPDEFDIVIRNRIEDGPLGPGNYLLVDSTAEEMPVAKSGTIAYPVLRVWDPGHPVMRGVSFSGSTVAEAFSYRYASGVRLLAGSDGSPLVFAYEDRERRYLSVGFDFLLTDIPFRPDFPIFIGNAVSWLYRGNLAEPEAEITAGTPYRMEAVHGTDTAYITRPDGRIDQIVTAGRGIDYRETTRVGIYRIVTGDRERRFAVNMNDERESDLTPRIRAVEPTRPRSTAIVESPLWGVLLGLILAIIAVEWFVWVRRW